MLHISRPDSPEVEKYLERTAQFEQCLREHSWFTVGSTKPSFHYSGSLGKHWQTFDAGVAETFDAYFAKVGGAK